MSIDAELAITCYAAPNRLERIFEAFDRYGWPESRVKVYEDVSSEEYTRTYKHLCDKRGVSHTRLPEWGGMQGCAEFAAKNTNAEWMIYFPDDVLPTKNAVALIEYNLAVAPEHAGAIQIPYWNYEDVTGKNRDQMFEGPLDWLDQVGWNPHWYGPAFYVNVNGAGFSLRKKAWEAAGGFPSKTWCLDEHISCRIWLNTDYTIITVPGAPIVHMGGASTPAQHRFGHTQLREATIAGWMDEWGEGKDELGARCRARMQVAKLKWGLEAR